MQLGCAAFPGGSPFSEGSWHCYPQTQLAPASEISLCSTLTASYLLQVCCIFSNSNFLIKKKKVICTAELCSPGLCLFGSHRSSEELCSPFSSYSCPCGYPSWAEAGTTQVTFTSFLYGNMTHCLFSILFLGLYSLCFGDKCKFAALKSSPQTVLLPPLRLLVKSGPAGWT